MSMMSCRRAQRLLSRSLDTGSASPDPQLEAHLQQCPPCRDFQAALVLQEEGLQQVWGETRSLPDTAALTSRILAHYPSEKKSNGYHSSRRWLRWAPGAALAATAAATLVVVALRSEDGKPLPSVAVAPAERPGSSGRAVPPEIRGSFPRKRVAYVPPPGVPTGNPTSAEVKIAHHTGATSLLRANNTRRGNVSASPVLAVPKRANTPRIALDDLNYLNGNPAEFARRWVSLAPDEVEQLEARIRASVKGGDSFVEVPFPRIATSEMADKGLIPSAVAMYKQERAIVDARLQRKVSLGVKRIALGDLCDRLTKETGIDFSATRGVADDKVTIFCRERPLRDLMRSLSDLLNFTWERTGEEGNYTYRLKQPLRAQLLEEELRNRDRNEALLALDREMERYQNFRGLSPEEARAAAEGASGSDKKVLESLGGAGWGPAALYSGLSAEQMNALRNGQPLRFNPTPSKPGELPLPPSLNGPILNSLSQIARVSMHGPDGPQVWFGKDVDQKPGVAPGTVPGIKAQVALELKSSELGEYRLFGAAGFEASSSPDSVIVGMSGLNLAVGVSPSAREPKNAEANKGVANASEWKEKIPLALPPLPQGEKTKENSKVTTADLLETIHKATGRDVMGDYYTKLYDRSVFTPATGNEEIFAALCRWADAARLRWSAQDSWLTFRSVSFFNDRPKEVPNRLLERWQMARKANGTLLLDTLAEMAQLTDVQLDAAASGEGARLLYGLEEWDMVRAPNLRHSWRLLASLPGGLRQALLSQTGVRYEQLTLAQQPWFVRATLGENDPVATLDDLAGATVQLYFGPEKQAPEPSLDPPAANPSETVTRQPLTARFTYRYGSPNNGLTTKVIGPRGMSIGKEDKKGDSDKGRVGISDVKGLLPQ